MGCMGKIFSLFLQLLVFIGISVGVTVVSPYLTSEKYSPGDTPNKWFRVVVVEKNDKVEKGQSYQIYEWYMLEKIKENTPVLNFLLPEHHVTLGKDDRGNWEKFEVLTESEKEQVIEVTWVGDDYETVSRYRANREKIQPMYFRQAGIGAAMQGLVIGLIFAVLSGFPIRRYLIKTGNKTTETDNEL